MNQVHGFVTAGVLPSTVLAEARLTYDGIGVIDDKQRPSLIARMFDWIYPF